MDSALVAEKILRRRKQCLVHRYLYYVQSDSIIEDSFYDSLERELRELVAQYPEIAATVAYHEDCPSQHVGSGNLDDYPRELQMVAESLRIYNMNNLDWWFKVQALLEEEAEDGPPGPAPFQLVTE